MHWVAILPLWAALLLLAATFAGRSRVLRLLQLALWGALAIAGTLLVVDVSFARPARVVFLYDEEPVDWRTVHRETLARFDQAIIGQDVGLLVAPDEPTSTVPPVCRPWSGGKSFSPAQPLRMVTAAALLEWALLRFEERCTVWDVWQRLVDRALGRALRIVIVSNRPQRWAELLEQHAATRTQKEAAPTSKQTNSALAVLAADAIAKGVRIDVLFEERASAASTPSKKNLEIRLPRLLPQSLIYTDARFGLRLPLAGEAGPLRRPFRWNRRCSIDPGLPGTAFDLSEEEVEVALRDGALVEDDIPIHRFLSAGEGLAPGFHLVECHVRLRLADREIVAEGSSYARAGHDPILMVAGAARSLLGALARRGAPAPSVASLRAVFNEPPVWWQDRWYEALLTRDRDWIPEERFCAELKERSGRARPHVVVLWHVTDAAVEACCPYLRTRVADGLHVAFVGAPRKETALSCGFIPAHAGASRGQQWIYDRRPLLGVLRDGSRAGRLPLKAPDKAAFLTDEQVATSELWKGEEIQARISAQLARKLHMSPPSVGPSAAAPFARLDAGPPIELPSAESATPLELDQKAWTASQVASRVRWLDRERALAKEEIHVGDVIILFTYDLSQRPEASLGIAELLARGATVMPVVLKTPYAAAISSAAEKAQGLEAVRVLRAAQENAASASNQPASSPLLPRERAARLFPPLELQLDKAKTTRGALDRAIEAFVAKAAEVLRRRLDPRSTFFIPHRYGRVLDERVGLRWPEVPRPGDFAARLSGPSSGTSLERWAAPVRFQPLELAGSGSVAVYASLTEDLRQPDALGPRPILVGGIFGQGQVLVSGYSLVEGAFEARPFGPTQSQYDPRDRIFGRAPARGSPKVDLWGPQRIIDLGGLTAGLEPIPGADPLLAEVRRSSVTGSLVLSVSQRLLAQSGHRELRLRRCSDLARPFLSSCTGDEMPLTVVGFDPGRQRLRYGVLPSGACRLCGTAPSCVAELTSEGADETAAGAERNRLFLQNRLAGQCKAVTAVVDLRPAQALAALARYTGGDEGKATAGARVADSRGVPSDLAALAAISLLVLLWAMRLGRRVFIRRGTPSLQPSAPPRHGVEIPQGLGADYGSAGARPIATRRPGAAAGMRALEPGDRLSQAFLEDVVLMSDPANPPIVPRVVQRIDERARRIDFLVNLGRGMRTPEGGRWPLKIDAAGTAVEVVARIAWQSGAEVRVIPIGAGVKASAPLGPYFAAPGDGVLLQQLEAISKESGEWKPAEVPATWEDCPEALVYVSDFLNEDTDALARLAARVEGEGTAFAAIAVFSPAELIQLDICLAPSAGIVCDRSEWTTGDLASVHAHLMEDLEDLFGETRGGMAVVSSAFSLEEVYATLTRLRLMELIR